MRRVVLDTETMGDVNNRSSCLVYDFGFCIVDDAEGVIYQDHALIKEVFCDRHDQMMTAYYAEKIPHYYKQISAGLKVDSFLNIWNNFKQVCKTFNVREVWAHNASFDRAALNNTLRTLSNGYARYFIPYGIEWRCTCAAAADVLCNSRNYFKFCESAQFVSPKGNVRTTAEAIYAYLINDPEYKEEHTALEDALIEAAILMAVLRRHKKFDATPSPMAWRKPQEKYKVYKEGR